MNYTLTITVDENDADYITEVSEVTGAEILELLPLFRRIMAFEPYKVGKWTHTSNFPTGIAVREDLGEKRAIDYYNISEEMYDKLLNVLPSPRHDFHSIESIYVTKCETILFLQQK